MKKKTPARPALTRERILQAAVQLADEGGIDALSMRKLGDAVGVKAMSLYNHVANKDEVLDGILDLALTEINVRPPGGDWKESLRHRARSAHQMCTRHPWAANLITGRPSPVPALLRYIDATIGILVGAGFSIPAADHAWNAMDSHIYGFTLQEQNFPFDRADVAEVAASYLPQLPVDEYPHMAAMTRAVAEGRHDGINRLEFGLELILDGLERLLERE